MSPGSSGQIFSLITIIIPSLMKEKLRHREVLKNCPRSYN